MPQFDFLNGRGQTLSGRLDLPEGQPRSFAVFAHCITCSKNVRAASHISIALVGLGIAVLRFDFTGLGDSDGDFANTNFTSNVADLRAAAKSLGERYQPPSLLIGHSLGGAAVLLAAREIESVTAVATIGAPSEPAHISNLFNAKVAIIDAEGSATIEIGGRPLRIERQFLNDIRSHQAEKQLAKLGKPVLIFHSPQDQIVAIDNARRIYEAAKHPKSFVSVDGADHMLTGADDASFVASILAAWASRYLRIQPSPMIDKMPPSREGVVHVSEVNGGLTQFVRAGKHHWYADEPTSVGGNGLGPDPYELLLASLGVCASMTLRMYARKKGWALRSISVQREHSRVHASDCLSCESEAGQIDRIEKIISVVGELDEPQVARLAEIADRCPVQRTLQGEKQIVSSITFNENVFPSHLD